MDISAITQQSKQQLGFSTCCSCCGRNLGHEDVLDVGDNLYVIIFCAAGSRKIWKR